MFLHLLKSKRMLAYTFFSYCKCLSLHSALEHAIAWGFLSILDLFLSSLHLSIKEFPFSSIWFCPDIFLNLKTHYEFGSYPWIFFSNSQWASLFHVYLVISIFPQLIICISLYPYGIRYNFVVLLSKVCMKILSW